MWSRYTLLCYNTFVVRLRWTSSRKRWWRPSTRPSPTTATASPRRRRSVGRARRRRREDLRGRDQVPAAPARSHLRGGGHARPRQRGLQRRPRRAPRRRIDQHAAAARYGALDAAQRGRPVLVRNGHALDARAAAVLHRRARSQKGAARLRAAIKRKHTDRIYRWLNVATSKRRRCSCNTSTAACPSTTRSRPRTRSAASASSS